MELAKHFHERQLLSTGWPVYNYRKHGKVSVNRQ